jgi:hypothetical protein
LNKAKNVLLGAIGVSTLYDCLPIIYTLKDFNLWYAVGVEMQTPHTFLRILPSESFSMPVVIIVPTTTLTQQSAVEERTFLKHVQCWLLILISPF